MMNTFPHPQPLPARGEGRFRLLPRKRGRLGGGHANLWLVIVMLALSSIFACHRHGYELSPDTINFHMPSDPILLNPILAHDAYSSEVNSHIFESLLERDRKTSLLKGKIAERYEVSADKRNYIFSLRKNVFFHDGTPLTSADVLFSYKKMMSPEVPNAHLKNYYNDVLAIDAPDAYTIVFRMKRPYAMALESLGSFEILPKHIYSVGDFMKHDRNYRDPIGSGPYRFNQWKTGQSLKLVGFDNYWGQHPTIKNIQYFIIKNGAVALQALKKGDVDTYNLQPLQWSRQTDSENFNKNFQKIKYLARSYRYIGYNMRKEPFNDRRVRLAMAYLMNLTRVKETILENLVEITTGPFWPNGLQLDKTIKPIPFDPEKALSLLAAAGYSMSEQGYLSKNGQKLEIELLIPAGVAFYDQFVSIIKQDFAKVGVIINLRKLEFQTLVTKVHDREFQAYMMGWGAPVESDPYQIWHTSQKDKGDNYVGFGNAETDALIEKARLTFDVAARNKLYQRFHQIVYAEQPYTFLYTSYNLMAINKRIENVHVYPLGLDAFEWQIRNNLTKNQPTP
jgi:peptide/nickel transport system substrate-binding protein